METKVKKTKNIHENHRQRLFDTIEKIGLENVNDYLALEFILTYIIPRKDTNPIAHRLLDEFGSVSNVFDANFETLMQVEGVGSRSAKLITLIPQIFHRYTQDKAKNVKFLKIVKDMIDYCKSFLYNKSLEEIYVICLNENYKILATKFLAKGTLNYVNIGQKDFFNIILNTKGTKRVILTHCHPDGSCAPSVSDESSTVKLIDMCQNIGVELIDHLIVGKDGVFSIIKRQKYLEEK